MLSYGKLSQPSFHDYNFVSRVEDSSGIYVQQKSKERTKFVEKFHNPYKKSK